MSAPDSGLPPRIGVVDDDPSTCRAIARLLRAAGFRAETFASAEAFLEARREEGFTCLVLDIHLPGLSGPDLGRYLAKGPSSPPIVFITAHEDPPTREHARQSGGVACLSKPFRGQHLINAIVNAVQRHPTQAPQS
jgi:FixJ family two-component response regulator